MHEHLPPRLQRPRPRRRAGLLRRPPGCTEGRSTDTWVDFDFFGHQISLHLGAPFAHAPTGKVGDHMVPMPHFGALLEMDEWRALADRLEAAGVDFVIAPVLRFEGQPGEQATMFLLDPFGNPLEFKGMRDPAGPSRRDARPLRREARDVGRLPRPAARALAEAASRPRSCRSRTRTIPPRSTGSSMRPIPRLQDFTPYTGAQGRAEPLGRGRGRRGQPHADRAARRMVDAGLTQGMVEWVTGHVLRHHLGIDAHVARPALGAARRRRWPPTGPWRCWGWGSSGCACARALVGSGLSGDRLVAKRRRTSPGVRSVTGTGRAADGASERADRRAADAAHPVDREPDERRDARLDARRRGASEPRARRAGRRRRAAGRAAAAGPRDARHLPGGAACRRTIRSGRIRRSR